MGMCSSVSRLGIEICTSGSAQFEIQAGRKEAETDEFLVTKILEVAQMREAKIEMQCEMGAYITATDFYIFLFEEERTIIFLLDLIHPSL